VAIAGGKIAAVEADIVGEATDTIDARGKIVTAGLIDIHTHAGRSKDGPALVLQDGVTGWVDAGSAGADNIDQIAAIARGAPQIGRALVNISRTGIVPDGELHDINHANVALAKGAIARNLDVVVGVKARLSDNVAGTNDLEVLRRAQEAAAPFNLPVIYTSANRSRRCEPSFRCSSAATRHPHVCARTKRHSRRAGPIVPGRGGSPPPRRHFRLWQRGHRSL
jgi:dihydroorotase